MNKKQFLHLSKKGRKDEDDENQGSCAKNKYVSNLTNIYIYWMRKFNGDTTQRAVGKDWWTLCNN